jgi:DUF2971 family protein
MTTDGVEAPGSYTRSTDHPRFLAWNERSYREDLRAYGVRLELHHYTSFDGLMGILTSNALWATDVRFLNDDTELDFGKRACFDALMQIRDRSLLPYVGAVARGLEENFGHQTFVTCFSRSRKLESQWREYAEQHRGFAVAFDTLCLSSLWARPALRLMPVEYGPKAQRLRAQRIVERALEDIQRERRQSPAEAQFGIRSRFTLLGVELLYLCASFKAWGWRGEQEWRLIYSRFLPSPGDCLPVLFRGDRDTPYVELNLASTIDGQPRPVYAAITQGSRVRRSSDLVQRCLRERGLRIPFYTHHAVG